MPMPAIRDISPTKIIALGLNYRDHAEEFKMQIPAEPIIFMKPSTAVIYPGDAIIYPRQATRVDYEAELAIVIGETARRVPADRALDVVLGFTCLNDVTERHLQGIDGQWTRAKSFDTFCPIGPRVIADIDPDNLDIACYLNGELKQKSNTSNLIFPVREIIAFVTSVMTLHAGDIIATGTPSGVGPLKPGDEVVVKIQGIGALENKVAAESDAAE